MVEQSLVPVRNHYPAKLTQRSKAIASSENRPVAHWGVSEIIRLVEAAQERGRGVKGERDGLFIQLLFDGALRVSEGLGLRPVDIIGSGRGYRLRVTGKRGFRECAVSAPLVAQLRGYAYEHQLDRTERFFQFNKHRAWQIVDAAADLAGLVKPPGVGTVHILRHSGAIERMRATGNPRSVQEQLGHASSGMTLRYFRTLSKEESLSIQEGVDLTW